MREEQEPEDELLEVVDDSGRAVGLRRRDEVHGNPSLMHRAVHIFVLNSKGEIYLQKRSRRKRIQPGRWDTSVGGHVAPGESWIQAAERELQEELDVSLRGIGGPAVLEYLHEYIWRSPVETELVRTYRIHHDGPLRPNLDEIETGRFWTVDEIGRATGTGALTPNLEDEQRRQASHEPGQHPGTTVVRR